MQHSKNQATSLILSLLWLTLGCLATLNAKPLTPQQQQQQWADISDNDVIVGMTLKDMNEDQRAQFAALEKAGKLNDLDLAEVEMNDEEMQRVRRVPLSLLMKRALSLFTHWRPLAANGGRYQDPSNDIVSAVSRDMSRPRGQPLRWG